MSQHKYYSEKLDENQNSTCRTQGELFALASDRGYKCSEFIRKYMKSKVAEIVDDMDADPYTYSHEKRRTPGAVIPYSAEELMDMLLKEERISKAKTSGELYDREIMYWAGWLYRFWHYNDRCRESAKVWRKANGQTMKQNYEELHKLPPEEAVEKLLKIAMDDLWR